MIRREQLSCLLIGLFISVGCLQTSEVHCNYSPIAVYVESYSILNSSPSNITTSTKKVEKLNLSLKRLLLSYDYAGSKIITDQIIKAIKNNTIDGKTLSESYYYIGVYHSLTRNVNDAIRYLNLCISIKDNNHEYDKCYGNALYNLGVIYGRLGDFNQHEEYSMRSLDIEKKNYGSTSPLLIGTYSSLIIAYIELQEYEKSLNFANMALSIATNKMTSENSLDMANLYNNLGGLNIRLADYTKAKIYLEKSESIYRNNKLYLDENYINLMNNMAITFGALSLVEKSDEYYNKGVSLAVSLNSSIAYNIINSFAIILGNTGKKQKGESLLSGALDQAKTKFGDNSRNFFEVLNNYADYLREYDIDNRKSLECYSRCIDYLNKNQKDLVLKNPVYIGYSLSLCEAGEPFKALETIQSLLFSGYEKNHAAGTYENPEIETIKADKKSLKILKTKYKILWDIYRQSPDQKILEAASQTAELIVLLLEKVRINISEEESRLVLGDRYRDSYLNAIRDFNLLYSKTSARHFLEKAFEYSEKSKVAGLLASTRELKATQFHIPSAIADYEKKLQRDISLFNARIAEEITKDEPDTLLLNKWNETLFETSRLRDSLVLVFEKKYSGYYALKYNTKVVGLKDISKIIGRDRNYINYIVSDTVIYVFIANRKHQQLLAINIDSSFFNNIRQFRSLLSNPLTSDNANLAFEKYILSGYGIYKILFEPVRRYLISNRILISSDNILSYLPFEAIPTKQTSGERMLYRDIAYLMNDFDISYTYSATFMAESVKKEYSLSNKLIAFAPNYSEPVDIKTVVIDRQTENGKLSDLPYARLEAEYVSDITGGELYENEDAKESVFKAESGKYDIIHLAMHTVLNDKDPMYSTLIFSPEDDSVDDSYLKTYEVYGIPLKAKMVVLSSCNTGTGFLYSGEGILSLARGFIYSGGQSVVMSMWEIEDRSGTEIVKMFYKNLIKGNSKSMALRKARIAYLKQTDQLRSHPYFWSTLIIYGNNSPLYYSRHLIFVAIILGSLIVVLLMFYFIKRKYS
jgi:CHAT domain-containing protein